MLLIVTPSSWRGQVPVTACSVTSRKKASGPPLLGERRLLDAARSF